MRTKLQATRLLVIAAIVVVADCPRTHALDLGGTARLLWVNTDFNQGSSRSLEQQLTLDLRQEISPYLSVALRHSHFQLDSRVAGSDIDYRRRFEQPRLDLLYSRPNFNARVGYQYRLADGTADPDNFEAQGITGSLFWRARPDLSLSLAFRDDVNETDVGALGRDTQTQSASAIVRYERRYWGTLYNYARTQIENRLNGLFADQDRHDIKFQGTRGFFDQRLFLGLAASYGRSDRKESVGEGADIAEPIPPLQGLFAIDLTPAVGELLPHPGLIDGDFVNPVSPPIEIGGANTFRNLGLDLGVTRPISRLEISVDRPSGPNVVWEVHQSRDNLFWEPVIGIRSEYDADLLRYTLFFSATENQYFKAVNVSTNGAALVQVTELRALMDFEGAERDDSFSSDLYRVDFSGNLRLSSRIVTFLLFGTNNDTTTVAGLLTRDRQNSYANAGVDIDLMSSLRWSVAYRWADSEDRHNVRLDRTTGEATSNLKWTPLSTVDVIFSLSSREEKERDELIQATDSSRLGVALQLLSDLSLYSDLTFSRTEDPFSGFDRDTVSWSQRLNASLLRSWSVTSGYNYLRTETAEGQDILDRVNLFLESRWTPGTYLTLTGAWRFTTDDFSSSLRQTYGLFYSPGPRLGINASWDQLDSGSGVRTGNDNLGATYRLHSHVLLSASVSRSRSRQGAGPTSEVTSARVGLTIGF